MKRKAALLLSIFTGVSCLLGLSACKLLGFMNKEIRTVQYELSSDGTYYIVASSGSGELEEKELVIPETHNNLPVKEIKEKAFEFCSELKSITIPSTITNIGREAFYGCGHVTEINWNVTELQNANDVQGSLVEAPIPGDSSPLEGKEEEKNYDIFCYAGCDGNGVTLNVGANVTKIPAYLFAGDGEMPSNFPNVTEVVFAENGVCEKIGESAFCECEALTSITIPASVTTLGKNAFSDCTGLEEINFNASAMEDLDIDNDAFLNAGQEGRGISVYIGANVTKIPARLFNSATANVDEVIFAQGSVCESIRTYAFSRCTLTSLQLSSNVKTIESNAFYDCDGLTDITIPVGVTLIEPNAFKGCDNLAKVSFQNTTRWYYTSKATNVSGSGLTLTDVAKNARYLTDTYAAYYWKRTV